MDDCRFRAWPVIICCVKFWLYRGKRSAGHEKCFMGREESSICSSKCFICQGESSLKLYLAG